MANENKDVIRVAALEAAMAATLRSGMLGLASDTNRLISKKLSDASIRYWSDDTKQMLLAGTQTVTGAKTFTSAATFSSGLTATGVLSANGNIHRHADGCIDYYGVDDDVSLTHVHGTGLALNKSLIINDTAQDTHATTSLTINHGGADDIILALQSSDISQVFTNHADADTWFSIQKASATLGGAALRGFQDSNSGQALRFEAYRVAGGASPMVTIDGYLADGGTGPGTVTVGTSIILAIRDNTTEVFTVNGDGVTWLASNLTIGGNFTMSSDTHMHWGDLTITNTANSGMDSLTLKLDDCGSSFIFTDHVNNVLAKISDAEGPAESAIAYIKNPLTANAASVLKLEQLDTDKDFIHFKGTSIDSDLTGSLVFNNGIDFTTVGYIKIYITDSRTAGITDGNYYIPLGTIALAT